MKERKKQGLTTDLTSESSINYSDDELASDNGRSTRKPNM